MATHSGTLAWKIPWKEEPGRLQSMGSQRGLSDFTFTFTFMHWRRKWQPTPVFLPGESQGRGSLVGCRLRGHTESDTTEASQQQQQLYDSTYLRKYKAIYGDRKQLTGCLGKGWVGLEVRSTIRGQRKHFGVMDNLHSLYCSCGFTCVPLSKHIKLYTVCMHRLLYVPLTSRAVLKY